LKIASRRTTQYKLHNANDAEEEMHGSKQPYHCAEEKTYRKKNSNLVGCTFDSMTPGSSTQLLEKLFYSLNSCHFLSHAYLHKYHQLVRTQLLRACFNVKEKEQQKHLSIVLVAKKFSLL